jgi:predicted SAM-dependent methyltransferase
MKIKKYKKYVPSSLKRFIKYFMNLTNPSIKIVDNKKDIKFCPICNKETETTKFPNFYLEKFQEHEFIYSPFQFETLNMENYSCKNCGASDRDRLISLYLKRYFEFNKNKISLLDFAPSKSLFQFIKNLNVNYRSADLFMEDVDDKVDIRNMNIYDDNSFDLFICSHVLEHIDDDKKAMKELHRITKKNGVGICLVPIMLSIENSVENKEYLESEHLRWKYFGQNDHVRMYSKKSFINRLKTVGFKVNEYGSDYFGKSTFTRMGIDYKSVLYVVEKT